LRLVAMRVDDFRNRQTITGTHWHAAPFMSGRKGTIEPEGVHRPVNV